MKRCLCTAVVALCAVLALGVDVSAAQELPEGLVAYWTLDEGTGAVAQDSAGGWHGTLTGDPTWVPGLVGNALRFDGIDDHVLTTFNPDAVIGDGNSYTKVFWFNQGSAPCRQGIVVVPLFPRFYFVRDHNCEYRVGVGSQYTGTFGLPDPALDTWSHMAIVFDATPGQSEIRVYQNGDGFFTHAYTGDGDMPDSNLQLSEESSLNNPFTGMLDEVAIYNRVLDEDEIQDNYFNGLAGKGLTETGTDGIWVSSGVTLLYTGDVDEVLAGVDLDGQIRLGMSVNNHSEWQDPVLEAPTLTMTLAEDYPVDWVGFEEYLVPGSEYLWELPDLEPWGWYGVDVALAPEAVPVSVSPGFHLTRTVSEPVLHAPMAQQTVTVTLTQEEDAFEGRDLQSVSLQIWAAYGTSEINSQVMSFTVSPPEFDCFEGGVFVYCIDQFTEVPRTYQVDVTFEFQLQGEWDQIEYAPRVFASANFEGGNPTTWIGTSTTGTNEFATWTWATTEPRRWWSWTGTSKEVDLESRLTVLNHVPTALCDHVFLPAAPDCTLETSIDAGSYDPDGDDITLTQTPPGPYLWPWEEVWLDVEDMHGATSSCWAWVVPLSPDDDGDGHEICGGDCDDGDALVFPGAEELCDGRDNDCNGVVDDGFPDGDGDTVADCLDICPTTYNPGQEDWNGDGVGDACQDFDGDGLSDETEIVTANQAGCPFPDNPDSDFDTLSDGDETAAGTDPCEVDTDGDGVDDAVDPLPTEPGVTGDWLEEELRSLSQTIRGMDTGLFEGRSAFGRRARRTGLAIRFHLASRAVGQENLELATFLLNGAMLRLDGASPPRDFMVESPEKTSLLEISVLYLELLDLM